MRPRSCARSNVWSLANERRWRLFVRQGRMATTSLLLRWYMTPPA
jgi:hypothetical protein